MLKRLLVIGLACLTSCATADAKKYVGRQVRENQQVALDRIDHQSWTTLLKKHVDADGLVDYRSWHRSKNDRAGLKRYLEHLSAGNLSEPATKQAKLAFWINAYNAVTIHGILLEYPTSSIRNHTPKVYGYNIWNDLLLPVDGKAYSLNQIEHQVLRKMNDARIHFAIVCASRGCPRLLDEAYTAKHVDAQLEMIAKDFFGRRQNFRYDSTKGTFYLSSILDWFGSDFGKTKQARLKAISKWLPTPQAQNAAQRGVRVSYLKYDWSLNEQPSE